MTGQTVEVVFSKTDIAGIEAATDWGVASQVAKLCKERARKVILDRSGKVPKLGVPDVSKADDGGLVLSYSITGSFA